MKFGGSLLLSFLHDPKPKNRSLAILTTLMQLPQFSKDRTLREQIAGFERFSLEYAKAGDTHTIFYQHISRNSFRFTSMRKARTRS